MCLAGINAQQQLVWVQYIRLFFPFCFVNIESWNCTNNILAMKMVHRKEIYVNQSEKKETHLIPLHLPNWSTYHWISMYHTTKKKYIRIRKKKLKIHRTKCTKNTEKKTQIRLKLFGRESISMCTSSGWCRISIWLERLCWCRYHIT